MRAPVRVVFVCSGNICRSPTAEVVLTRLAHRSGREWLVDVSSAGTGDWHAGQDMDRRSRQTLDAAGYEPGPHTARQFTRADVADHDLIVALDSGHYADLREMADVDDHDRIVLLRRYDPDLGDDEPDVSDPYYGGASGFADVLAQVERSCAALLDAIEQAVADDAPLGHAAGQQPDSPPL